MKMTAPFMVQTTSGDSATKTSMVTISSHAVLRLAPPAVNHIQDHTDLHSSMDFQDKSKLLIMTLTIHRLNLLIQEVRPVTIKQCKISPIQMVTQTIIKTVILITTKVSMSSKVIHKKSRINKITYRKDPSQ